MQPKKIASYDNHLLANMTLGYLQENGIYCYLQNENTILADPLLSNAIGGIGLMVSEKDEATALALIILAENNYLKEKLCKKCVNYNLQIEEKADEPTTFWAKLKNNILYGQTNLYSKKIRCTNCNTLYDGYSDL